MYTKAENHRGYSESLNLYVALVRIGLSTILASVALLAIVIVLFAPTLPINPFGRTGQVILGTITSIAAFRLYKVVRMSNVALLRMGRDSLGSENVVEPISFLNRIIYSISTLILSICLPIFGIFLWSYVENLDTSNGILSTLSEPVEIIIVLSLIIFEIGIIINFVGFLLIFWSMTSPFRFFAFSLFRRIRLITVRYISNIISDKTGVSLYTTSDIICNTCYNSRFLFINDSKPDKYSYRILCSNCGDIYGQSSITEWETTGNIDFGNNEPSAEGGGVATDNHPSD